MRLTPEQELVAKLFNEQYQELKKYIQKNLVYNAAYKYMILSKERHARFPDREFLTACGFPTSVVDSLINSQINVRS